jgi:hypothetical protein
MKLASIAAIFCTSALPAMAVEQAEVAASNDAVLAMTKADRDALIAFLESQYFYVLLGPCYTYVY